LGAPLYVCTYFTRGVIALQKLFGVGGSPKRAGAALGVHRAFSRKSDNPLLCNSLINPNLSFFLLNTKNIFQTY
ncbi:MAG: hypothetical protein J6S23_07510, partial [Clostridia bacterium]|nr:hypothetical protein [Clostridia bacterium]